MKIEKIKKDLGIDHIKIGFKLSNKWFSSLKNLQNNTLVFINKIDKTNLKKINRHDNLILLLKKKSKKINDSIIQIETKNPKLIFFRIVEKFSKNFKKDKIIGKNTILGKNVSIGKNVVIGNNCVIHDNVVIHNNVKIGNFCNIKSNSVIGQKGFGTVKDENNNWYDLHHVGGVIMKDHIQVGALNTIAQGTIDDTIISSFNKFDDHIHIAHNCNFDENNNICAGVIFGGSVSLGKNNFIGLNSTIRDSVKIENNNFIGQSTNVVKDIKSNCLVYGNPGQIIKK